jgi:putative hydrolase of the HAD superfamily
MASLRVVFLDVGETVMRPNPSWEHVYGLALTEHGVDIPIEQLGGALREVYRSGGYGFDGRMESTPSPEGSFRRLVELDRRALALVGIRDLPEAFYERLAELFMVTSHWHVFPDVYEAIEALKMRGLRLGIISNWSWQLPELLHALDLVQHFEVLAVSARVGADKPHPLIFEHALELADVRPDEAMHVGDNLEADVAGALAAGIAPVLIDRAGRARDVPADIPVIGSLAELPPLVDRRLAMVVG